MPVEVGESGPIAYPRLVSIQSTEQAMALPRIKVNGLKTLGTTALVI